MTEYFTEQASLASQARQESLSSLLIAMLESFDADHTYVQLNSKLEAAGLRDLTRVRGETSCRLFYDEPTKAKNHDRIVVLNGLRFAISQILNPNQDRPTFIRSLQPDLLNWVRWVQRSRGTGVTEYLDGEVALPGESPEYRDPVASSVSRAVASEICANNAVTALVESSFAGRSKNPLLAIVVNVLKARSARSIDKDDLLHAAIVRLYARIDSYRPGGNFLAWWRKLVDRCLLDMLVVPGTPDPTDSDPIDFAAFYCQREDSSATERFSDQDWKTIRGWAENNVKTPVVVLVGVGWVSKVKEAPDHWDNFCQWLVHYGVADPEAFYEELTAGCWTTSGQLKTLAEHAGQKENTVRKYFHRSFAGIHQTSRQTSFGKMHHLAELTCFWRQGLFIAAPLGEDLKAGLRSATPDVRVAALCCAPAWPLAGSLPEWLQYKADYPFQNPPALFEFLRPGLDIKPEHRDLLPPSVRNNIDKAGYIREQILAHSTTGNFAECRKLVSQTRAEAASLEAGLRECWRDVVIGG